jgi:hypothetical protein
LNVAPSVALRQSGTMSAMRRAAIHSMVCPERPIATAGRCAPTECGQAVVPTELDSKEGRNGSLIGKIED